ncbi:MAG: hypothetical protein ABEI78_00545, partial [Candidatus Nanohaloarchaea archaeon]
MGQSTKQKLLAQIKETRESLDNDIQDNLWRLFPHTFAQVCSQKAASGEIWKPYWYLKVISQELVKQIADSEHTGLLISLPPRHGKSEFLSVWTPLWFLNNFPGKKVSVSTYSDDFSAKWGGRVRDEIQDNPLLDNVYLKKGKKGKSNFS